MSSAVHKKGVLQSVPCKGGIKCFSRFNKEVSITAGQEIKLVPGFFQSLELSIIISFSFLISDPDPIAEGTDITEKSRVQVGTPDRMTGSH